MMEKEIMSIKIRNKYTRRTGELKKRNPEKVVMDRYYHPRTFKSRRQELQELDADYEIQEYLDCLLYTSPSPRDGLLSRMPSSA